MRITIAGYGFVGRTHHAAFKKHHTINIVDPKIDNKRVNDTPTDGLIICVSTPEHSSGACNYSNIIAVLNDTPPNVVVLIKSTVSLEGWQDIKKKFPNHQITFSPEFLREKTALEDFKSAATTYMGGGLLDFWKIIYTEAFPDKYITTAKPEELILAKYFRNSFLATKVSFFNQVYDLCTEAGINYENVKTLITDDIRIGDSHTLITPERGFGGHCFPKDTAAIIYTAEQHDIQLTLIKEAITYNSKIRKH